MADKQLVSCYDGTLVKVGNRMRRVDKGDVVPDGADADHVKALVDRGMLAEGEPTAGYAADDIEPPFEAPAEERSSRRHAAKDEG